MQTIRKVLAYVVADDHLLVLMHPHHLDVGVQVPGGTVEPDEALDAAVLREVREETGLSDLGIPTYLGTVTFDMSAFGRAELHERHFFRLAYAKAAPEGWQHVERNSGGGTNELFQFSWAPLACVPELAVGHGAFLHALRRVS